MCCRGLLRLFCVRAAPPFVSFCIRSLKLLVLWVVRLLAVPGVFLFCLLWAFICSVGMCSLVFRALGYSSYTARFLVLILADYVFVDESVPSGLASSFFWCLYSLLFSSDSVLLLSCTLSIRPLRFSSVVVSSPPGLPQSTFLLV